MTEIVIGSLFSGYGGLDQGVEAALLDAGASSVRVAWVSDIDPGARRILAHRYPGVPNLGDITAVDWHAVEPVHVLAGGFPCQDVSGAGLGAGLMPGTRSGLWSQMAYAASILRPRLIVAENVRGLLSAPAHSDVEPCPWCLGDPDAEPPVRALGAVLGDLAVLGYDAEWLGLPAARIGAPHNRFRVFVAAWPTADADGQRRALSWAGGHEPEVTADPSGRRAPADPDSIRPERGRGARDGRPGSPDDGRLPVPHAACDGRHEGRPQPAGLVGGPHAPVGRDTPPPDAGSERHGRGQDPGAAGRVDNEDASGARERERARGIAGDRGATTPADPDSDGLGELGRVDAGGRDTDGRSRPDGPRDEEQPTARWGPYGPAVARWAGVLGRPAPDPTTGGRLNPRFVEWMMGLPDGWVTDVPDLKRNDMLKALGNGVVPQQAAAAVRELLGGSS